MKSSVSVRNMSLKKERRSKGRNEGRKAARKQVPKIMPPRARQTMGDCPPPGCMLLLWWPVTKAMIPAEIRVFPSDLPGCMRLGKGIGRARAPSWSAGPAGCSEGSQNAAKVDRRTVLLLSSSLRIGSEVPSHTHGTQLGCWLFNKRDQSASSSHLPIGLRNDGTSIHQISYFIIHVIETLD